MTGQKQSVLFASSAYRAQLRLVYANRTPTEIALFMAHYDSQSGTHSSFSLPSDWPENVWDGWGKVEQDEKILAIDGRWRYAAPPRISQQKGKTATAEIVLVQVPGTESVEIEDAPAGTCPGAGPPLSPGTPINPAPGAPSGPDGNGPGGFPGGGGGSGGGDGGDGDGDGGPSGSTPSPSPGPGAPAPTPEPEPEPEPDPQPIPDTDYIPIPVPPDKEGQKMVWCVTYNLWKKEPGFYYCKDGSEYAPGQGTYIARTETVCRIAKTIELKTQQGYGITYCPTQPGVAEPANTLFMLFIKYTGGQYGENGNKAYEKTTRSSRGVSENSYANWPGAFWWLEITQIRADGIEVSNPMPRTLSSRETQSSTANNYSPNITPRTGGASSVTGVFPHHTPSRRSMKYGEWNTKKFNSGMSGQAVTLPLPKKSIKSDVILELVYANRADGVARDFMNHYLASAGEWDDFTLPGEKLKEGPMAGWSVNNGDRYLSKGRWAYNRPPKVTSVHPGTSTVTVQLISLESEAFAGPGVEITPLDPCECPPAYSPGEPSPDVGGPDGPTPSPSPGPGKPSPEPPATVPPNWPSDFDPAIWPPGVPISAPVPSSKNPITEPDDDWQEANNPEKEVYYIRFKWKSFGYREGTEVCRKPGFGPCSNGTPQGERYAVGPAHSKIAEGNWDTWINLPGIQYGAAWTLYPWDDDANFGYWYKPPGSGFDNSSITQRGVCFAPDDYTTDKYTCDEVNPNYLSRRGIIRLMSSQTMTSGATTELSSLWGSNNPNLSDDEGLWTHATVITQVQLRPASSSEWIPYVDNSTAWSGLSATRSASGPTQQ